jgi:hypothetical protein
MPKPLLSEPAWQAFWEAIRRIVSGEMAWMDKRDEVLRQAQEAGAENDLAEFVNWFATEEVG